MVKRIKSQEQLINETFEVIAVRNKVVTLEAMLSDFILEMRENFSEEDIKKIDTLGRALRVVLNKKKTKQPMGGIKMITTSMLALLVLREFLLSLEKLIDKQSDKWSMN